MNISIQLTDSVAHLNSGAVSYVLAVVDGIYLVHRYFGAPLRAYCGCGEPVYYKRSYTAELDCSVPHAATDDFPFEYPVSGRGDFRVPALTVTRQDGVCAAEPLFQSWRVLEGKPPLEGLPSTFAGDTPAKTLEIICEDRVIGLRVVLYYTVFENLGVVARHQRVEDFGCQMLMLENVQSASLELPAGPWELLALYGTHAREANRSRCAMQPGIRQVESTCGSSSPRHQPFLALPGPHTTETEGGVYALHLCYSGNFLARAQQDSFGTVRAQIGIHPEGFRWRLCPGERFTTPEAILTYSGGARFDPGMLYYVAQNWTSDNTDALDRLTIQDGFSLLYPPAAMGAHVSIAPNHQTGRFYRHDTGCDNYTMWSQVAADGSQVQMVIFQKRYDPLCCHTRFRALGLDAAADYRDTGTGRVYGGDELMQLGLTVPLVKEDCHAFALHLERC